MDLIVEFASIVDALSNAHIEYAICGGFAVNIHGHVRATRDVDLLIQEASLEAALKAVADCGFTLSSGRIPFGFATPEHREIVRVSKVESQQLLTLDFMLVTPVFEEVWRQRTSTDWNGRRVTVVSRAGLWRMKKLAGRTQDLADIEHLGLGPDDANE